VKRALLLPLLVAAASQAQNVNTYIRIATPSPLPNAYQALAYSIFLQAVTFQPALPVTWTVVGGSGTGLPSGLTLNSSTGELAGTPGISGQYSFTIQAQLANSTAMPDTKAFQLTVASPSLAITTASVPSATVGVPYQVTLTAAASPSSVTWSVSGQLPPGLSITGAGVISGNPTTPGSYSFRAFAQITNTNISTFQDYVLNVYAGQVMILTSSLPVAYAGQPYSATLSATGTGVTWALATTSILPAGITFDPATATFSGTTNATGAFQLQVQASAPNAPPALQNLTLYVGSSLLRIVETSLPIAIQGMPYRVTLTPNGGLPPYSWGFASTNNQGMTIDSATGAITGVPPALGSFTLVVSLADTTNAQPFTRGFTFFVASPLTVLTTSLAPGTTLLAYAQTLTAGGGQAPFTWTLADGSGPLPPGLNLSSTGQISGTVAYFANGTYTFTAQVTDVGGRVAIKPLSIVIGAATTPPALSISVGSGALGPGQQPPVNLALSSKYPADISVAVSVGFQSSVGGDDQTVQFITEKGGTRNLTVIIPANALAPASAPVLATGTLAGTMNINAQMSAGAVPLGPPSSPLLTIPTLPPVIQAVSYSNTGTGATVTVTGYSTTRDMISGTFTFTPASGAPTTVTTPLASGFSTWYQNAASNALGGQFELTLPFTVPGNTASVTVTLTNSVGTSAPASTP
jgi:hypothetical protein